MFESDSFQMRREEYMTFLQLYNAEYCIEMSKGFIGGDFVYITDGSLKGFRSCLVSAKNERNEGNGGHLKVVEG